MSKQRDGAAVVNTEWESLSCEEKLSRNLEYWMRKACKNQEELSRYRWLYICAVKSRKAFRGVLRDERAKSARLVGVLNHADSAIAMLLEREETECRGDEDCDHCFALSAQEAVKEALLEHTQQMEGKK